MMYFRFVITIFFFNKVFAENCGLLSDNSLKADFSTFHRNITKLNLVNNNLLIIKRGTFNKYMKLEELSIINSRVSYIEDGAFYDLTSLRRLNITKNFISRLSSEMFRPYSELSKLDVSNNILSDLGTFDITLFPRLSFFDTSSNQIGRLPQSLLEKVIKDKNFTFMSTNNPVNCLTKNYQSRHTNFFRNLCSKFQFIDNLQPQARKVPPQANFTTCLLWIAGAFWIGIIVGNLCLIKRLLFTTNKNTKKDQSTQYEYIHRHSDVFRPSEHHHVNFKKEPRVDQSSGTLNITV